MQGVCIEAAYTASPDLVAEIAPLGATAFHLRCTT
jgi:hypothetical protein